LTFSPEQLYTGFEATPKVSDPPDPIESMADFERIIESLYREVIVNNEASIWVFRGVGNASYGFSSSLFRRVWWTKAVHTGKPLHQVDPPDEAELASHESQILIDVHRAGLHEGGRGRLSILRQLALLQHNHAPTRLIDVSFNLWVGLWFATEQQHEDGRPVQDKSDGRLFVIDITIDLSTKRMASVTGRTLITFRGGPKRPLAIGRISRERGSRRRRSTSESPLSTARSCWAGCQSRKRATNIHVIRLGTGSLLRNCALAPPSRSGFTRPSLNAATTPDGQRRTREATASSRSGFHDS
jgi:hypothetical protein